MTNITPDQPETSQPQLQKANPAALLTKCQVATLLNCSLRTVHNLIAIKAIPYVRIGRAVRIRPEAVTAYIESSTVKAFQRRAQHQPTCRTLIQGAVPISHIEQLELNLNYGK